MIQDSGWVDEIEKRLIIICGQKSSNKTQENYIR